MGTWQPSYWLDDQINLLTDLWNKGFSASIIAAQLNKTRNAVIGKAHRLKLSKPRSAPKGEQRQQRARTRRVATSPNPVRIIAQAPIIIEPPAPVEGGVSIVDLERFHCRAVVGSGPDGLARFCGAHKEGRIMGRGGEFESAYCLTHGALYYNRPEANRERAN